MCVCVCVCVERYVVVDRYIRVHLLFLERDRERAHAFCVSSCRLVFLFVLSFFCECFIQVRQEIDEENC